VAQLPGLVAVSPVYETVPVGGPPAQGSFLNAVAELWTAATPLDLLEVARQAEAVATRQRAERWGPRTLDVDVLLVGDLVVDLPELQVPHPRMWERGFVLVPLGDLAPEIVGDRLRDGMRAGVTPAGNLDLHLELANLDRADLDRADLDRADLDRADLDRGRAGHP
jgi:2-amino-4-hydroxy-6-hydroxymethyldihydropteridine diphosphokinase